MIFWQYTKVNSKFIIPKFVIDILKIVRNLYYTVVSNELLFVNEHNYKLYLKIQVELPQFELVVSYNVTCRNVICSHKGLTYDLVKKYSSSKILCIQSCKSKYTRIILSLDFEYGGKRRYCICILFSTVHLLRFSQPLVLAHLSLIHI